MDRGAPGGRRRGGVILRPDRRGMATGMALGSLIGDTAPPGTAATAECELGADALDDEFSDALRLEQERLVVVRCGTDYDPQCLAMDEALAAVAEEVRYSLFPHMMMYHMFCALDISLPSPLRTTSAAPPLLPCRCMRRWRYSC